MGRIFDTEGGFDIEGDFNYQNKSRWSVYQSIFVGLEQGSVMLEIKFKFHLHTNTIDIHVPPRL